MKWDNIKEIIGQSAPVLGGLLGGPVGASVGGLISTVLGTENNPEAVLSELKANAEAVLKLKQIEVDHKIKLEDLRLKEIGLILKDVENARTRQVQSEKATGKKDWNLYLLAWTIVVGYFGLITVLIDGNVPEDKTGVVYMLFGTLATAFGGVIQYFFGSSAGSKQKADHIRDIARRQ